MNQADRKEFDIIHQKIDNINKVVNDIKVTSEGQHEMLRQDIKFVKENLFNPHEGLWAETKLNTQFRESTTKWRGVIGVGFVALIVDKVWSMITGG
jgi:hypothetical protein